MSCYATASCVDFDNDQACLSEQAALNGLLDSGDSPCLDGNPPVSIPSDWRCPGAYYGGGDGCDCGCGAIDADCAVGCAELACTATSCEYCYSDGGSQQTGTPDSACADVDCGVGAGACVAGVAVSCVDGLEASRQDCATLGRICVQEESSFAPQCVLADPACGASGLGVCSDNQATVCAGGQVETLADCSAVGRICGVIPDSTGLIGCISPGEGEGEGEGDDDRADDDDDECRSDRDCADDEECNDRRCEPAEESPLDALSCTQSGTAGVPWLALLALLPAWRRSSQPRHR